MKFKDKREQLNSELERFISTLNDLLPRYTALVYSDHLTADELSELGEIEYS